MEALTEHWKLCRVSMNLWFMIRGNCDFLSAVNMLNINFNCMALLMWKANLHESVLTLVLFLMWTILIVFTEFVSILLLFHILVFLGCEARGIFRTWTEPASLALEGDVLTTGLPRKSHTGICVKIKLQPQSHWEGLELYLFLLNTVYKLILKSSLF